MTIIQQIHTATLISELGLCVCGSGTEMEIVFLILERAANHLSLYDPESDAGGRWVEFAAHVLDGRGFLEHGCGIGSAWLSEKGEVLFSFLKKNGTNRDNWPELVRDGICGMDVDGKTVIGDASKAEKVASDRIAN